jgi:hypothetical protein
MTVHCNAAMLQWLQCFTILYVTVCDNMCAGTWQVLFSVMQNYRPEIPPEDELPGKPGSTLPRYLCLMEACWAEEESVRPTFEDVVTVLDEMRAIDCVRGPARDSSTRCAAAAAAAAAAAILLPYLLLQ